MFKYCFQDEGNNFESTYIVVVCVDWTAANIL